MIMIEIVHKDKEVKRETITFTLLALLIILVDINWTFF